MRTVAATRQQVLRPEVTAEEYRHHMAKVKRWVLANDERFRPFAFAWGYHTNAKTWAAWPKLETIENEIVKHKTFKDGKRPHSATHRDIRRAWRKAGILAREADYYGEDGRGRHGSGLKIGVTRYFNFNRVIRNGVAEDFDFHAPLDTESETTPSEAVVKDETTPSDYPLVLPPRATPSITNSITNPKTNPTTNCRRDREVDEIATWDGDVSRLILPARVIGGSRQYYVSADGTIRAIHGQPRPGEVRATLDLLSIRVSRADSAAHT